MLSRPPDFRKHLEQYQSLVYDIDILLYTKMLIPKIGQADLMHNKYYNDKYKLAFIN